MVCNISLFWNGKKVKYDLENNFINNKKYRIDEEFIVKEVLAPSTEITSIEEGNLKPLSKDEVDRFLYPSSEKKNDRQKWEKGDEFNIINGPFENFSGIIKEFNNEKIKALIEIFGRKTPVELDFNQIE
jgi:transcription antitermination factor NusG